MTPESVDKQAQKRSIAQINRSLRSILEAETLEHYFWAAGKVDRLYRSDRGHIYFDLVDGDSSIRCMLREEQSGHIKIELVNHLDVEVYGDIGFFERFAAAEINVLDIRSLHKQVDELGTVEKLRAEGLYPPRRRPAPAHIRRIGLITSRSSFAVGDFETTYQAAGRRAVLAPLTWQYVHLEGERAGQSIVDGIALLERNPQVDVIAIIRGGGRQIDMAVFDQLQILRAIAGSAKYIVTGIGHQRDHCLADDLADHAAVTPTAAANYLAELCQPAMTRAQRESPARSYAESMPADAPPYDEPPPHYDPPPYDDFMPEPIQAPQPAPPAAYRLLVVALLVLAIAAAAFLAYAILQTA